MINVTKVTDKVQKEILEQLSRDCPLCHGNLLGTPMSDTLLAWGELQKLAIMQGGINPAATCQGLLHIGIRIGVEYANKEELERTVKYLK